MAAAVVFFTNLGAVGLWDEDEPLYASCAREMLQRGDWVVPTFNGEMFPEKPPLVFWLMMSGFELFGVTEFAARFWSAVLGVGTALLTYHLGRLLFRAEVGLWAGLIVATSIIFTVSARAATVDSALVFFTTAAILVFVAAGMAKRPKTPVGDTGAGADIAGPASFVPDSWLALVLFYACLGLAVLTKGPVGFLLPMVMIGLFLLVVNYSRASGNPMRPTTRQSSRWTTVPITLARVFSPPNVLRTAWQMRPLTAIVIVGAVSLPWYVWVSLRTEGAWLAEFLGEQNLGRALKPLQGHSGPFYYYLPAILIGFFPWSVFLGPSLAQSVRQIRQRRALPAETVFVLCWLGVFVGLWSIPSTKLPHYVLTAYPALALLTAVFVDAWITDPARMSRWWMRNANLTLIVVGVGMLVALPIVAHFFLPGEWMLGLVGLVLVAGGAWGLYFAERGRGAQTMVTFAVTAVVFLTAMFGFAALRVDRYQNAPALVAKIRDASPGRPQMAGYRYFRESLVFYAGEPLPYYAAAGQLQEFLDAAEHPYVLTTDGHEKELQERFPEKFSVLIRRPRFLRSGEVVVLGPRTDRPVRRTATGPGNRTLR